MKTKIIRQLLQTLGLVIVMVFLVIDLPTDQANASTSRNELVKDYLNNECKYLYLGENDKNTFDFNIKKDIALEGATYYWYIKENKGNPDSATIDSKTGVVNAKKIGTAYIRCKITLADKTVLRPEAKVIVRNRATEVVISNVPKNYTIMAESSMNFNRTIVNTAAGNNVKTSDITRWEIANDTAGVETVSNNGIVRAIKEGEFSIRAVCFLSVDNYRMWLNNKEKNKSRITAASKWVTIKVDSIEGTATTAKELDQLLRTEDITRIILSTNEELGILISDGDYSNKTLIVESTNIDIKNYAMFKRIILNSSTGLKWEECINGNNITIIDDNIKLYIAENAHIDKLDIGSTVTKTASEDSRNNRIFSKENIIKSFSSTENVEDTERVIPFDPLEVITSSAIAGSSETLNPSGTSTTGTEVVLLAEIRSIPSAGSIIVVSSSFFGAGQFGFTSTMVQPPTIVPANPGIQFTPPPSYIQVSINTSSSPLQINNSSNTALTLTGSGSADLNMGQGSAGSAVTTSIPITATEEEGDSNYLFLSGSEGSSITFLPGADGSTVQSDQFGQSMGPGVTINHQGVTTRLFSGESAAIAPAGVIATTSTSSPSTQSFKTTPINSTTVIATSITAGQNLSASILSGVFRDIASGQIVTGTLTWRNSFDAVNSSKDFAWIFTPTDTSSYTTVEGTATVTVINKVTTVTGSAITATAIQAGQNLSASEIVGSFLDSSNNQEVEGVITWDNPGMAAIFSDYYPWTFTPTDIDHYYVLHGAAYVEAVNDGSNWIVQSLQEIIGAIKSEDINLYVSEESFILVSQNTPEKQMAVESFINNQYLNIIVDQVTWNPSTMKYDITISLNDMQTLVSIVVNFYLSVPTS